MPHAASPAPWRPLLSGELARKAASTAHEIALELRTRDLLALADDASLADGWAGTALLFGYLHLTIPDDGFAADAERCLDRASALVASRRMGPALYQGFAGVAWAMTHLRSLLHPDLPDPVGPIDDVLAGYLRRSPWRGDYDLVSGLVGFGVYALERLGYEAPQPAATACLTSVVERLAECAERRAGGVAWRAGPDLLPPHVREECPAGHFNLGVAHGTPGAIALLGAACAAGVPHIETERLVRDSVPWLLAQRVPDGDSLRFPKWVVPDAMGTLQASRSAWCYGDPGVAATLLSTARALGEPTWEREAVGIALGAAGRSPDEAGVVDAGLCHGAAGLAHVFNRLWQATGDDRLREAAVYWIERTLAFRRPGRGVGGFVSYASAADGWVDAPGFLTGAAGVALALLAAATDVEPAWDAVLLLSPAGRGGS